MTITILGLDGATWDLLDPLMAAGHMPHLRQLAAQGTRSPLHSTWPPVTALAWPAFYTGQNPGKHGVFSFVQRGADGREQVIDADAVQVPALWDWAAAAGLHTGVIGVPVTYPVPAIDGFFISGFLTPPHATHACQPPDVLAEIGLDPDSWTYHIPPLAARPAPDSARRLAAALIADIDRRQHALQRLHRRYRPDLLIAVFMAPDTIQHKFWGYLHPRHEFYTRPEAEAVRAALLPVYTRLDAVIGVLAREILPAGTLLLMSDHGFGPLHRRLALNNALARHGYLNLRRGRLLANRIRRRLQRKLPLGARDALRSIQRHPGQNRYIDWSHTRAFAGAAHELCIHLNRSDRYRHGIVPPQDVAPLRRDIAAMLLALRDETGAPLLAQALPPEELYHGPALDRAPDLLLRPADERDVFTDGILRGNRLYRPAPDRARGWHREQGILLAVGRGIRPHSTITPAPTLLDLAPTILHLLGFRPAAGSDGRVLAGLLNDPHRSTQPLPTPRRSSRSTPLRPDAREETALHERLRGLGYLD